MKQTDIYFNYELECKISKVNGQRVYWTVSDFYCCSLRWKFFVLAVANFTLFPRVDAEERIV